MGEAGRTVLGGAGLSSHSVSVQWMGGGCAVQGRSLTAHGGSHVPRGSAVSSHISATKASPVPRAGPGLAPQRRPCSAGHAAPSL